MGRRANWRNMDVRPSPRNSYIERIRSFYYRSPVRPFTIHTASGESYTVKHPETMAIDEEDDVLFLLPGPGKLAMLDIASITEMTQDFTKQEINTRPTDLPESID